MNSKVLTIYRTICQNEEEIRTDKVEHVPFDSEEGAWFFLKEKRGFVVSIYEFATELSDAEINRFNKLFFSKCVQEKTNLIYARNSRRSNKALNRAEIAELMGFTGNTAVTKCTTFLNKLVDMNIIHLKTDKINGKTVEQWYINPLFCKTYYRVSVDLYEMFQETLDIFMANQQMLLNALKEALEYKYTTDVTTMDAEKAQEEVKEYIAAEEKNDFIKSFMEFSEEETVEQRRDKISKIVNDMLKADNKGR